MPPLVMHLDFVEAHLAKNTWVERVHARPAYQKALEKGGEYDFA